MHHVLAKKKKMSWRSEVRVRFICCCRVRVLMRILVKVSLQISACTVCVLYVCAFACIC